MTTLEKELNNFTARAMKKRMKIAYKDVMQNAKLYGVYIWGCGRLGKFARVQCEKNGIAVKGYIDNDARKINSNQGVFSCDILKDNDVVIVASVYYPDIIEQLENMNIKSYIYYENLAIMCSEYDTYYQAFERAFEELEENKEEYLSLYPILADDLSKEIYANVMLYKMTMDVRYTIKAYELSIVQGKTDFDELIVCKLKDSRATFYDVGGFDGESTKDFIECIGEYEKIYYFEPDKNLMDISKKELAEKNDIVYVQAVVGKEKGYEQYEPIGGGAGSVSKEGQEKVDVVTLDNFVSENMSYIKMDVEGYEMNALLGARRFITEHSPVLSVSVYHKPGDMHQLIKYILSINPNYKVYIRHYTKCYADTRCYFISE